MIMMNNKEVGDFPCSQSTSMVPEKLQLLCLAFPQYATIMNSTYNHLHTQKYDVLMHPPVKAAQESSLAGHSTVVDSEITEHYSGLIDSAFSIVLKGEPDYGDPFQVVPPFINELMDIKIALLLAVLANSKADPTPVVTVAFLSNNYQLLIALMLTTIPTNREALICTLFDSAQMLRNKYPSLDLAFYWRLKKLLVALCANQTLQCVPMIAKCMSNRRQLGDLFVELTSEYSPQLMTTLIDEDIRNVNAYQCDHSYKKRKRNDDEPACPGLQDHWLLGRLPKALYLRFFLSLLKVIKKQQISSLTITCSVFKVATAMLFSSNHSSLHRYFTIEHIQQLISVATNVITTYVSLWQHQNSGLSMGSNIIIVEVLIATTLAIINWDRNVDTLIEPLIDQLARLIGFIETQHTTEIQKLKHYFKVVIYSKCIVTLGEYCASILGVTNIVQLVIDPVYNYNGHHVDTFNRRSLNLLLIAIVYGSRGPGNPISAQQLIDEFEEMCNNNTPSVYSRSTEEAVDMVHIGKLMHRFDLFRCGHAKKIHEQAIHTLSCCSFPPHSGVLEYIDHWLLNCVQPKRLDGNQSFGGIPVLPSEVQRLVTGLHVQPSCHQLNDDALLQAVVYKDQLCATCVKVYAKLENQRLKRLEDLANQTKNWSQVSGEQLWQALSCDAKGLIGCCLNCSTSKDHKIATSKVTHSELWSGIVACYAALKYRSLAFSSGHQPRATFEMETATLPIKRCLQLLLTPAVLADSCGGRWAKAFVLLLRDVHPEYFTVQAMRSSRLLSASINTVSPGQQIGTISSISTLRDALKSNALACYSASDLSNLATSLLLPAVAGSLSEGLDRLYCEIHAVHPLPHQLELATIRWLLPMKHIPRYQMIIEEPLLIFKIPMELLHHHEMSQIVSFLLQRWLLQWDVHAISAFDAQANRLAAFKQAQLKRANSDIVVHSTLEILDFVDVELFGLTQDCIVANAIFSIINSCSATTENATITSYYQLFTWLCGRNAKLIPELFHMGLDQSSMRFLLLVSGSVVSKTLGKLILEVMSVPVKEIAFQTYAERLLQISFYVQHGDVNTMLYVDIVARLPKYIAEGCNEHVTVFHPYEHNAAIDEIVRILYEVLPTVSIESFQQLQRYINSNESYAMRRFKEMLTTSTVDE